MASYLPQYDGYLSYFLLYSSSAAMIHSLVCYLKPPQTSLRAFSGPSAGASLHNSNGGLLARVYGVKNVYTGLIRAYAAYHLANGPVYDLAMCTFAGVLFLYATELGVYGTVRLREAAVPFVTSGAGLLWMGLQRGSYVVG
ncbi:hypothetical protein Daus18300_013542 [Diaporthe australafricana]|uniref:Ergosterol biosynthesis protein Erg28 n=1 Tax=Diaporthe australafricana TaxID=127596 RepID=A0ABR3VYM9_9PEZI